MKLLTPTDLPPDLRGRTVRRSLAPSQILFQQGETSEYLYWVVSGRLRLVSFVDERTITHYFVEAGELIGENVLYADTYSCTVMAETAAEVIAIPKQQFVTALQESPTLSDLYLKNLTQRFQSVKSLLELRSISSARERLLHYLMQRRSPDQNTVILDKPLRAIASELALTPEALSRLLSRLQAEGVITRKKRSISLSQEWLEDIDE